jgi:hypothetical protein
MNDDNEILRAKLYRALENLRTTTHMARIEEPSAHPGRAVEAVLNAYDAIVEHSVKQAVEVEGLNQ